MGDSPPLALSPPLARRPQVPCRLNILLSRSKEMLTALPEAGWRRQSAIRPRLPACLSLATRPLRAGRPGSCSAGDSSAATPQIVLFPRDPSDRNVLHTHEHCLHELQQGLLLGLHGETSGGWPPNPSLSFFFFFCENAREIAIGEDRLTVKYPTLKRHHIANIRVG